MLITAGIHGNEAIGPTALLYGYPHLKPEHTRIIYLPIANPSGYTRGQRETYPAGLDPNRDYPIDHNTACYQTSATRIMDALFRDFPIDLTLNLHNGADEIGWNWGTFAHRTRSHTPEYLIQSQIANMLHFRGGYNPRLSIPQFSLGTMTESVYPAPGTLDDWAYAGSWDPSVPHRCNAYQYAPYPPNMHNGLMFLFELGMHAAPDSKMGTSEGLAQSPTAPTRANGYVTRAIRMLHSLLQVLDPRVTAIFTPSHLFVKVQGCKVIHHAEITLSYHPSSNATQLNNATNPLLKNGT